MHDTIQIQHHAKLDTKTLVKRLKTNHRRLIFNSKKIDLEVQYPRFNAHRKTYEKFQN